MGYGERNNVGLCERRAEKTNRFPWKEIMFRLHPRRPHKADREEEEDDEEEGHIWARAHTHFRAVSDGKRM